MKGIYEEYFICPKCKGERDRGRYRKIRGVRRLVCLDCATSKKKPVEKPTEKPVPKESVKMQLSFL
jgi:hypothetical protein